MNQFKLFLHLLYRISIIKIFQCDISMVNSQCKGKPKSEVTWIIEFFSVSMSVSQ